MMTRVLQENKAWGYRVWNGGRRRCGIMGKAAENGFVG